MSAEGLDRRLCPGGDEFVAEAEQLLLLAGRVREVLAFAEGREPDPRDLARMTSRGWAAYRAAGYR